MNIKLISNFPVVRIPVSAREQYLYLPDPSVLSNEKFAKQIFLLFDINVCVSRSYTQVVSKHGSVALAMKSIIEQQICSLFSELCRKGVVEIYLGFIPLIDQSEYFFNIPATTFFSAEQVVIKACEQYAGGADISLIPVHEKFYRVGLQNIFDADQFSRHGITLNSFGNCIVEEYVSEFFADTSRSIIKHIFVDGDHTLWKGVIGEVGASGIGLSGSHLRLQDVLKSCGKSGVLISLVTKNDSDIIEELFDIRSDMIVERGDFLSIDASYNPKSQVLKRALQATGFSPENCLFIDDNPLEVEEVSTEIRGLKVLQFEDSSNFFEALSKFRVLGIRPNSSSSEDIARKEFYRDELDRIDLKIRTKSQIDFTRSLDLRVRVIDLSPKDSALIARVAQLSMRTNQFNLCIGRYEESEIKNLLGLNDCAYNFEIKLFELTDKFGKYGIIGAVFLKIDVQSRVICIDEFFLSCRALGRNLEYWILSHLFITFGNHKILGKYRQSQRNKPFREFYSSLSNLSGSVVNYESYLCEITAESVYDYKDLVELVQC